MSWINTSQLTPRSYRCGYCGKDIASEKGYYEKINEKIMPGKPCDIYLCHHCNKPSYFDSDGNQTPGEIYGNEIKFLPSNDVELLYNEARFCFSINAFTSSVMCCRKLLMNFSVAEGAKEGDSFAKYVDFLDSKGFIPPKGKEWVDSIRKLGNEANHTIELKSKDDAKKIIKFTEMLLKFNFEVPGIMAEPNKNSDD